MQAFLLVSAIFLALLLYHFCLFLSIFLALGVVEERLILNLLSIADYAPDLNSNEIVLTLNVGNKKHNSSMCKDKICELLHLLDIENNDCIKQIQINYRYGPDDKIEKAYLKNKDILLKDNLTCPRSITGLDNELLNQAIGIIEKNDSEIYDYQQHRNNRILRTSENIELENPMEGEVINNGNVNEQIVHA